MKVTHEPSGIRQKDIDALHDVGLGDAAVHDVIQVVAYFNYVNRVADAVGVDDEPEWRGADGGAS